MENALITSERFIDLFITLKEIQFLKESEGPNLYNLDWSFDAKLLSEFIFHSQRDYRYRDILECFIFRGTHCISLIAALNRALQRHLLTGIYDDKAYISKYYTDFRVIESNKEYVNIMKDFIEHFDYFCLNKDLYLKNAEAYMNEDLQGVGDNSRMIFDLQRRIKPNPEDKE